MPEATTPNYGWAYPTINASADTWGETLNAAIIAIDAQVKSNDDAAKAAGNLSSGTVPGGRLSGSYTGISGVGTLTAGGTGSGFTLDLSAAPKSGTVPLAHGGTGAADAAGARTALDVPTRGGGNASGTWSISISGNAATASSATTAAACTGNSATASSASQVANAVTFNNGGSGGASGSAFNGNGALTVSYNTVGAPKADGTGASGTWGINITGNAATVTNGVTTGNIGSHAPGLTGSGASGTWGINITGSAASAANATNAANATTASQANTLHINGGYRTFDYSGQSGQPTYLWGTNNGSTIQVWNPANFSVNYATASGTSGACSGNAATAGSAGQVANSVTFNNGGGGGGSGSSFNGSGALTVSYNTVGAPRADGAGASGTWGISITGSAASATTAGSIGNSNANNAGSNALGNRTVSASAASGTPANGDIWVQYV